MLGKFRVTGLVAAGFILFTAGTWAQTIAIEGDVKGQDGQPLKGAEILIERKDIKGTYKGAKTDKKGHYIYNGLPLTGTYKVTVMVNGQTMDSVDGVQSHGEPAEVNFDLRKSAAAQQAATQANQAAQDAKEAEQDATRGMTKEQKEAFEKRKKENEQINAHNKALNDAFNAGMQAMEAKQYDTAVDSFKKASEIDPNQTAVWAQLAGAYSAKADAEKSPDKQAARQMDLQNAADAYTKALALKPEMGNVHLNLALVYADMNKVPEAQAETEKAAQLDPTQAGKAYYNMGAKLTNSGQTDAALDFYDRAIKADPNYADAYYQKGLSLMAKVTVGKDGKQVYPPGTAEAFQKYLELKPTGSYADTAKSLLQAMGETVQTNYSNPSSKSSGKKK